jgi:hypothetical protein
MKIFADDLLQIPNEFFNKEENIENLLKITDERDKVVLIMKASRIISNEKLINVI